jgi:hypothetical protein
VQSNAPKLSKREMVKRWESSVLGCTKYPEWKNICGSFQEIVSS